MRETEQRWVELALCIRQVDSDGKDAPIPGREESVAFPSHINLVSESHPRDIIHLVFS